MVYVWNRGCSRLTHPWPIPVFFKGFQKYIQNLMIPAVTHGETWGHMVFSTGGSGIPGINVIRILTGGIVDIRYLLYIVSYLKIKIMRKDFIYPYRTFSRKEEVEANRAVGFVLGFLLMLPFTVVNRILGFFMPSNLFKYFYLGSIGGFLIMYYIMNFLN